MANGDARERTEDRTKFEDTFEVIFYYYMYLSENLISLKVTLTQRRRLQRPQPPTPKGTKRTAVNKEEVEGEPGSWLSERSKRSQTKKRTYHIN
jgi:hypothetical protein